MRNAASCHVIRLAFFQVSLAAAVAASAPLKVGDMMPTVSGQSVSGKLIKLPAADAGTMRLVVFSFSRAAAGDSQLWNEQVARDAGWSEPVITFRVIMLESVPRLFRAMAVAGIKNSMPQGLWDTTVLSYEDETNWNQYLSVSTEKKAYVILLGRNDRVCWLGRGPYADAAYADLKKELLGCERRDAK